jgi:ketosteroid isomerase-like protein
LTGEASERVAALRAGVEAFNRRDFAVIAELLAPDFEFVSPMTTALRGEKAVRLHVYLDRAEALRAAGIETD